MFKQCLNGLCVQINKVEKKNNEDKPLHREPVVIKMMAHLWRIENKVLLFSSPILVSTILTCFCFVILGKYAELEDLLAYNICES